MSNVLSTQDVIDLACKRIEDNKGFNALIYDCDGWKMAIGFDIDNVEASFSVYHESGYMTYENCAIGQAFFRLIPCDDSSLGLKFYSGCTDSMLDSLGLILVPDGQMIRLSNQVLLKAIDVINALYNSKDLASVLRHNGYNSLEQSANREIKLLRQYKMDEKTGLLGKIKGKFLKIFKQGY